MATEVRSCQLSPAEFRAKLAQMLGAEEEEIVLAGPFDARLLLLRSESGWIAASLGPGTLGELALPTPLKTALEIEDWDAPVAAAWPTATALHRLSRPRVVLVSLYKPEIFPLPRFALGISDLARAVRGTYTGQVELIDMQLGHDVAETAARVAASEPDVVGVSATFGQHDVLLELLDRLREAGAPTLIVGGSLAALNFEVLSQAYPGLIVADGPGEPTMEDVVAHWHGDLDREEIRGIVAGRRGGKRPRPRNLDAGGFLPELDLLGRTLDCSGVMQLESSRGCTHACSFCPRSHKGLWAAGADTFERILEAVQPLYAERPHLSRKIFLVDEEFVGHDRDGEALERCERVARQLAAANFVWETSTRVDQVARDDRSDEWHVRRIEFWRALLDLGLARCLFGVESGVDSILRRFNKHTTSDQNVKAIRTLTAMGVPIRCTYITFDPLMTLEELAASYEFQGRTDLLLRPHPEISSRQLLEAVRDDGRAALASVGKPFYEEISYMLVSMECLIGSPYLRAVEAAGLARGIEPLMGRRGATYKDSSIGLMSNWSQRWIDRSFSFDYTLKSLEKISHETERRALRELRAILKRGSYELLGSMLDLAAAGELSPSAATELADWRFRELVDAVAERVEPLVDQVDRSRASKLVSEHQAWKERNDWGLINAG